MKIDVHAHYIPEKFYDSDGSIHVTREGTQEVLFNAARRAGAGKEIYDIEVRLREMDVQGVDMHVLSVLPPLFVNHIEAKKAVAACHSINNAFAEAVSRHPDRFFAIANLPMQSPQDAARELECGQGSWNEGRTLMEMLTPWLLLAQSRQEHEAKNRHSH